VALEIVINDSHGSKNLDLKWVAKIVLVAENEDLLKLEDLHIENDKLLKSLELRSV